MTETPPKGSSILDAMPAKVNNGYLLAPPGAEFGTTLTEQIGVRSPLNRIGTSFNDTLK